MCLCQISVRKLYAYKNIIVKMRSPLVYKNMNMLSLPSANKQAFIVYSNSVINTARRQCHFDASVSTFNPIPHPQIEVMRPCQPLNVLVYIDIAC